MTVVDEYNIFIVVELIQYLQLSFHSTINIKILGPAF